jgi:DNA-binding CsgD family transcriptional regulator
VGEAFVETVEKLDAPYDADSSEPLDVREELAGLAKAVQDTLDTAPAHATNLDAVTLCGVCVCVPQAGDAAPPSMNLLLLTPVAGDQHAVKITEMEGGESAETRLALRNLLNAMQRAFAATLDEESYSGAAPAAKMLPAGADAALPHHKLSEREFQVVQMLSKGQTVGAISKVLNLSVKTVSTYRVRALKKMNFKTNAELIRYMIQHQLG